VLDIAPKLLTMPAEKKKEFAVSLPVIAVPLESTRTLLVDAPPLRVTVEVPPLVEPKMAMLLTVAVSIVAPPTTASPPFALSIPEIVAEAALRAPEIVADATLRAELAAVIAPAEIVSPAAKVARPDA